MTHTASVIRFLSISLTQHTGFRPLECFLREAQQGLVYIYVSGIAEDDRSHKAAFISVRQWNSGKRENSGTT